MGSKFFLKRILFALLSLLKAAHIKVLILLPTAAPVGGTAALTYETVFSTKETHITGLIDIATNQEESIKQEYKVSDNGFCSYCLLLQRNSFGVK